MPDADSLPIVLIPGLTCTARLYAEQIPALWPFGPVTVADHRRDDSMAADRAADFGAAPQRFALAGLSMGGYIAFRDHASGAAARRQACACSTPERAPTRPSRPSGAMC